MSSPGDIPIQLACETTPPGAKTLRF